MHMLSLSRRISNARTGFTIVELLIVIVVIAILAAISIVAYAGIQERARDAMRASALSQIRNGLQLYHIDNERYPDVCFDEDSGEVKNLLGTGYHCEIEHLRSSLVPKYIDSIPDMTSLPAAYRLMYTIGPQSSNGRTYALAMLDFSSPIGSDDWGCRYLGPGAPDWFFGADTPACIF